MTKEQAEFVIALMLGVVIGIVITLTMVTVDGISQDNRTIDLDHKATTDDLTKAKVLCSHFGGLEFSSFGTGWYMTAHCKDGTLIKFYPYGISHPAE